MLRIEHYSKTYPGGKRAVDDLTLHVRPGEIYGFIGHNGAGKTTTLRACAGVMDFTQGTITIDGHDVKKDPVGAKRVTAFLPDNPDLYEVMKGIDYSTDAEARKRGYRTGLDTLVVHAVNDEY